MTHTKRRRSPRRDGDVIATDHATRLLACKQKLHSWSKNYRKKTKSSKKTRAHSTNAELKTILRQHLNDIQALEQNVTRQIEELVQALPHLLVGTSRNLPFDMIQDYSTFKTMARSVDQQYVDMDRVFRAAGLDGVKSEVADSCISRSSGDMLKSRARILTPFKSQVMVKTLWRYFETCQGVTLQASQARDLQLPLGISTRIAVLMFEIALDDYVCIMRMLVKQFVKKDRTVHVWNVITDWPGLGTARKWKTHERGWGFVQPIGDGNSSSCLSYSLVNPTVEGIVSSENCETIKSLIKVYQRIVSWRLQSLENQTLDQAIQDEKHTVSPTAATT